MIRRLDYWLGKRIFHPPIIWVCQRAGINQYAFYRYAWWAVALHGVWMMDMKDWAWSAFTVIFALGRTVSVAVSPDRVRQGSRTLRLILLTLCTLELILEALAHDLGTGILWNGTALAAEYAITISTIPPRKLPEARVRAKEQVA